MKSGKLLTFTYLFLVLGLVWLVGLFITSAFFLHFFFFLPVVAVVIFCLFPNFLFSPCGKAF